MARYRIVCTTQVPASKPPAHQHIVEVGTGTDPAKANKRWSLAEVIAAMRRSDTFYTQGVNSGKVAEVDPYTCPYCSVTHIRSRADAVPDNNLDNLRRCSW